MDYTICRQHMYTKNEEHGCTQTQHCSQLDNWEGATIHI